MSRTCKLTVSPFSSTKEYGVSRKAASEGLARPSPRLSQRSQSRSMLPWCSQKIGSLAAVGTPDILPPTSTCTAPWGLPSRLGLKPLRPLGGNGTESSAVFSSSTTTSEGRAEPSLMVRELSYSELLESAGVRNASGKLGDA